MDSVWDPERLQIIGSVLSRYGEHLHEGTRIRLGMEGDPCSTYRSADDAPRATVIAVERDGDEITFRAQMDNGGIIERSIHEVSPGKLWEVAPEYIAAFRAKVEGAAETVPHAVAPAEVDHEYRRAVESRLDTVEERISHVEGMGERVMNIKTEDDRFRSTMADTVRALAEDVIRQSEGKPMEFVWHYARSYDDAVESRYDDPSDGHASRGTHQHEKYADDEERESRRRYDVHQGEKYAGYPDDLSPDALSES